MLIDWADSADADLAAILAYFIARGEESTGKRIVSRLIASVSLLKTQPLAGRAGRIDGTRELVPRHVPYVLVYRIASSDTVEIVRVIHTSRLFPETLADHNKLPDPKHTLAEILACPEAEDIAFEPVTLGSEETS